MKQKRILVADDEEDYVTALQIALEAEGYECITARDGQQALDKAKKERPDLIILDVMMPKMNGYKVSRLLKFDVKYEKIPIIMLTARAQEKDRNIGKDTGADEYVTKPFDIDALVELVAKYLKAEGSETKDARLHL